MFMPASVIIVGGAVEPELSKPFNENDVLHNDTRASLEHTLAVVEVPEADVRRDPAEICVNVVHKTLKTFRSSAETLYVEGASRKNLHCPSPREFRKAGRACEASTRAFRWLQKNKLRNTVNLDFVGSRRGIDDHEQCQSWCLARKVVAQ